MPAIYRRTAWVRFAGAVAATDADDVLGNVNALNTCFTATIYILLLREDSSMEYIPGIVCSNGTDWRRCACDMPSSFLTSAAGRTLNRGEAVRQRRQHLSSNGKKTNPPKASLTLGTISGAEYIEDVFQGVPCGDLCAEDNAYGLERMRDKGLISRHGGGDLASSEIDLTEHEQRPQIQEEQDFKEDLDGENLHSAKGFDSRAVERTSQRVSHRIVHSWIQPSDRQVEVAAMVSTDANDIVHPYCSFTYSTSYGVGSVPKEYLSYQSIPGSPRRR